MQFQGIKSTAQATLCRDLEKSGLRLKKKTCTKAAILHSSLWGVVPLNIITMPLVMYVLLVFQWIEICEPKISGSKHIAGSRAWGFVAFPFQYSSALGRKRSASRSGAATQTRSTMIVRACTGTVGGFHRRLVEDTHMEWLPDRMKCAGKNM